MNLIAARAAPGGVVLDGGPQLAVALPASIVPGTAVTAGIRAAALRVTPRPGDVALPGRVDLAEISGSDTFVHVHTDVGELVLQLGGVHTFTLGEAITLQLGAAQFYVFDAKGDLLVAPDSELKRATLI